MSRDISLLICEIPSNASRLPVESWEAGGGACKGPNYLIFKLIFTLPKSCVHSSIVAGVSFERLY